MIGEINPFRDNRYDEVYRSFNPMKSIVPSIHFDLSWLLSEWIHPEKIPGNLGACLQELASLDSFDH